MIERLTDWKKEHPGEPVYVCPKCRNKGLIRRAYDEFGNELFGEDMNKPGSYDYFDPCPCTKTDSNQVKRNNKKFAAVPRFYEDARFNNFEVQIYNNLTNKQSADFALRMSKKYVSRFKEMEEAGMGLYIFSEARGSGKTRLASTITNELIANDIRVRFDSANDVLSEIQKSWNDNNISEQKILERYIEPRVLVVDDLGARSGKDWIDEKFLMIIDARYRENKVTIFTSNYEIERLPFRDTRIIDRLNDVDRFYSIKMPNETVRKKQRNGGSVFEKIIEEERNDSD